MKPDDSVQELLDKVVLFYDIVEDLELNKAEILEKKELMVRIAGQTADCCRFLQSYAEDRFCRCYLVRFNA